MTHLIRNAISAEGMKEIYSLMETFEYFCGTNTATGQTKKIKNNLQTRDSQKEVQVAAEIIKKELTGNFDFVVIAQPQRLTRSQFALYSPGMTYGFHYDAPFMSSNKLRTDVSCTVFLNDDYEGGELEIKTGYGTARIKGNPGDAVVYPSGSYHRVAPITKGERKVAVMWIQSRVKDVSQREILMELSRAVAMLTNTNEDNTPYAHVKKAFDNLRRMWMLPIND